MKNQLLLPRNFRAIGLVLLPFAVWLFLAAMNHEFRFSFLTTNIKVRDMITTEDHYNLTVDVSILLVICSLAMIAFSKLKHEDEYLVHIRLRSLQIAVYLNYAAFLIATFMVNGLNYLMVLECNTVTVLVVFILVFNYSLYIKPRFSKSEPA